MYKLFVFAAVLACAAAAPGYVSAGLGYAAPLAYSGLGYSSYAAPAISYAAPAVAYAAPAVSYAAPAVAYSAPVAAAIPAPVTYNSGYNVAYHSEPVEQHGYKIAY